MRSTMCYLRAVTDASIDNPGGRTSSRVLFVSEYSITNDIIVFEAVSRRRGRLPVGCLYAVSLINSTSSRRKIILSGTPNEDDCPTGSCIAQSQTVNFPPDIRPETPHRHSTYCGL